MPKLLVFAPCEKVIVSQDENNPTLIAVLTQVGGTIKMLATEATEATVAEVEPEAVGAVPMRWTVFTTWHRNSGDEGKTFLQNVRLIAPSGKLSMDSTMEMTMTKPTHRIMVRIEHFPVENGAWELQLFLTEKGQQKSGEPLATYPLIAEFNIASTQATGADG
jgi:hypothetical protein